MVETIVKHGDPLDNAAKPKRFPVAFKIRRRSRSAPASIVRRTSRIEEHYRVDTERNYVLPGAPVYDDDWARDLHDFFNLVVLIPVVVLNALNWRWDRLLDAAAGERPLRDAWVGEWNDVFYDFVVSYFLVDLLWVLVIPDCVKSPGTIIVHHVLCLVYCALPLFVPGSYHIMGLNMSVEANTWFLIARRVFNKQGMTPWTISVRSVFSIRIKLVSLCFYATWITIRLIVYPYILVLLFPMWRSHTELLGTRLNHMLFAMIFQLCLCVMNLKWTKDLIMAKIRFWKKGNKNQKESKYL